MTRSLKLYASAALIAAALPSGGAAEAPLTCPAPAAEARGLARPVAPGSATVSASRAAGTVTGVAAGGPVTVTTERGVVGAAGTMTGTTNVPAAASDGKETPPRVTGVSLGGPVTVTATYRDAGPASSGASPAGIAITEEGGPNQHADKPKKPQSLAATGPGGGGASSSTPCPTPQPLNGNIKKSKSNISTN